MSKKIWLSVHPRNFGCHVTVRSFTRPFIHTTGKPMCNDIVFSLCGSLQAVIKLDDKRLCYGQLAAVSKGHPLTSIK